MQASRRGQGWALRTLHAEGGRAIWICRGDDLVRLGRAAEAVPLLEKALSISDDSEGVGDVAEARFVDEPGPAVDAADDLITSVMRERGYPVEDFDQRADLVAADLAAPAFTRQREDLAALRRGKTAPR